MELPIKSLFNCFIVLVFGYTLMSCKPKKTNTFLTEEVIVKSEKNDSIAYSFSFFGCNRIEIFDSYNHHATNGSTANLYALKRIFSELLKEERKPDLLFLLGDIVLGETNTTNLDHQLRDWVALYNDHSFSSISTSNIEVIAVPGNHEMLYAKINLLLELHEYPLKGATEIWMKHMSKFMPEDRDQISGTDSIANQLTFSFRRNKIGFILLNTDTFNEPTPQDPHGVEGQIPLDWVVEKLDEYQKDASIEHIFVLGHRPYYIAGKPETGHSGLPSGPILWPKLNKAKVVAMLSAHLHDYQRMQPGNKGTYQIISGNGGSKGPATFFGYSTINILKNGAVELITKGYDLGTKYYDSVPNHQFKLRDYTSLSWSKNSNPYDVNQSELKEKE